MMKNHSLQSDKRLILIIFLLVAGSKLFSQELMDGNKLSIHAGPTYLTSHGIYAGLRTGFQYKWETGYSVGTEATFSFGLNDRKKLEKENILE